MNKIINHLLTKMLTMYKTMFLIYKNVQGECQKIKIKIYLKMLIMYLKDINYMYNFFPNVYGKYTICMEKKIGIKSLLKN